MKVKNILGKIKNASKSLFSKLPVTLILIFISTIYVCIYIDVAVEINENILKSIYDFLFLFTLITLFIETTIYDFKNKIITVISYILNLVITTSFVYILDTEKDYLFGINIDIVTQKTLMLLFGLIICLLLFSIYKMYKKSNLKFEEYIYSIFQGGLQIIICNVIISLGISIIYWLFDELIFTDLNIMLYSRMMIIVQGMFFIPALLKVFYTENLNKEEKGFKILVLYIILPLYVIISFILYIYIAKIFIVKELPTNFIFPVVLAIFIAGFFIYNFIRNYKDMKFIKVICKILPIYLIPLVALQIYAVIIKFLAYGVTPIRYVTYMFLIFEIITIFLMIFKNAKKIHLVIFVCMGLTIISTYTPINLISVSNYNQNVRLNKYMNIDNENMTDKQREIFISAYNYLNKQVDKEKYITEEIELKYNEINNILKDNKNNSSKKSISYYTQTFDEDDYVDISKYYFIKKINYYENEEVEFSEYSESIKTLVNNLVKSVETQNIDIKDYEDLKDNILNLDEKYDLLVNSIYINYYENNGMYDIDSVSIKGYILVK